MNINNIRPANTRSLIDRPRRRRTQINFAALELFRHKPRALEFRELMIEHGLTQITAAELCCVPLHQINKWLQSRHPVDCPDDLLKKLKKRISND